MTENYQCVNVFELVNVWPMILRLYRLSACGTPKHRLKIQMCVRNGQSLDWTILQIFSIQKNPCITDYLSLAISSHKSRVAREARHCWVCPAFISVVCAPKPHTSTMDYGHKLDDKRILNLSNLSGKIVQLCICIHVIIWRIGDEISSICSLCRS